MGFKKKIKIACFGAKALPYVGGIENVLANICPRLVNLEYEVSVYVRSNYTKKYFKKSDYNGVNIISIPCIPSKHLEAPSHTVLSIIHAIISGYNVFFFNAVVLGLFTIIPKFFDKIVILETHGLDWKREKWGRFAKCFIKISSIFAAYIPHLTFCVGGEDARYFKKRFNKKFNVIPNGVNIPLRSTQFDFISDNGLEKGKYLLFMSRLVPEKGCHILLDAWNLVENSIKKDIKLAIAGDTNYRDRYYYDLLRSADDTVIFLGFVKGEGKRQLLTHALGFVQPSKIEGLSISLLEAMSYGVFPIVSNIQENLDVVGSRFGKSFETGNIINLKDAIEDFLLNKEKFCLSNSEISSYVIDTFNWDRSVYKLDQLIKGIMY